MRAGKTVGISDHGGWAVLVTVGPEGKALDRRRVELVEEGLPKIPHHCEAQGLPVEEGVALVERVRASAEKQSALALEELDRELGGGIGGVALRVCPELPATVAECIADYKASNTADWVMYRRALAGAAEARGWRVHWYEAKKVVKLAGEHLGVADAEEYFAGLRKEMGAPWTKDHQVAMAAAIVAGRR